VEGGGPLLIEGGEVGYRCLASPGFPSFAANVLHCVDWDHDGSGGVLVHEPEHPVMSAPYILTGPIPVAYHGYGDQDAVSPANEAQMPGSWTSFPTLGSVVVYDPNSGLEAGQVVYFTFNYAAMEAAGRRRLLQNSVAWLLAQESGHGSVTGRVTLHGQTDHSGVMVKFLPGSRTVLTDQSGNFSMAQLFPGTYQVVAAKANWATAMTEVQLGDGDHVTGVDLELFPVATVEFCSNPNLAIPDNNPMGVVDSLVVPIMAPVSELAVYVDIAHTWTGDLQVELTSPAGSTVRLHNRTGNSVVGIQGWYPDELAPADDLTRLVGEIAAGHWVLRVADLAGNDLGTLTNWCLRVSYPSLVNEVAEEIGHQPQLSLLGNFPNPFNPQTDILFTLPQTLAVELAVFDLGGRQVVTLVQETLPPGRHAVSWRGIDSNGQQVASGLYIYRLRTDGKTLTGKMLLLK
jgi:subtilisin-like proprotein convertase family protein